MNTQQHIENCETFLKHWANIKPEQVSWRLSSWRARTEPGNAPHTCNTIACAGGWLSAMPEFQAMGVLADRDGAPVLYPPSATPTPVICKPSVILSFALSDLLFGEDPDNYTALFDGRSCYETEGTDHEVVTRRFQKHLEYLRKL